MTSDVSFELSKLLKEKGFEDMIKSYDGTGKDINVSLIVRKHVPNQIFFPRPTIAEVVMWLFEKYEIWIDVSLTDNSRCFYFDYTLTTSKDRIFNDEDCFDSARRVCGKDKHNTSKKAYEAAIKHVLTNLI